MGNTQSAELSRVKRPTFILTLEDPRGRYNSSLGNYHTSHPSLGSPFPQPCGEDLCSPGACKCFVPACKEGRSRPGKLPGREHLQLPPFEGSVPISSSQRPHPPPDRVLKGVRLGGQPGCGRACAAEGGGGRHPALGRRPRRLGVAGAVRSAQGYDQSPRLSRSRARKALLCTQGGGTAEETSTR